MTDSDALMELQTQISYQEDTIAQLNDVVARLQREVVELQQAFKGLKDQVQSGTQGQIEVGNTPPPHY